VTTYFPEINGGQKPLELAVKDALKKGWLAKEEHGGYVAGSDPNGDEVVPLKDVVEEKTPGSFDPSRTRMDSRSTRRDSTLLTSLLLFLLQNGRRLYHPSLSLAPNLPRAPSLPRAPKLPHS